MDVMATIYLHTTAGAAVSGMDLWLEIYFLSFNALRWAGCISSLRRFGPQAEEGPRLVADLGKSM